jgi:hypothetical protein
MQYILLEISPESFHRAHGQPGNLLKIVKKNPKKQKNITVIKNQPFPVSISLPRGYSKMAIERLKSTS